MGLFQRVSDIISANLNDMVDRFEDPERMLRQAIREMASSIEESTAAAARVIASEKLLAKELNGHELEIASWQERAEKAVASGDDDLARRVLARRQEHEKLARALKDQLLAAQKAGQTLRRQVEAMRAKLAEAKRKLATLTARLTAADACRRLRGTVPQARRDGGGFSRFEELRERVELAEAEADALMELSTAPGDKLETDLAGREADLVIESELVAIRKRLRESSSEPPSPGSPA